MSAIYWRDGKKVARLSGAERAYMGNMIQRIFVSFFNTSLSSYRKEVDRMFPSDHYIQTTPDHYWAKAVETALSVGYDLALMLPDGSTADVWQTALNTALSIGSDQLKLLARLHGQCEIHAYVEGANRKWLAGIIQEGQQVGLMRPGQGWDDVVSLLLESDDCPVVTDYSVCESFPNPDAAAWEGDPEAFWELPEADRWERGIIGLRDRSGTGQLEIRPDMLGGAFGERHTVFSLLNAWAKIPV